MTDFTFHTLENTTGHTRELLEGIRKGYGFIPNLFAYMAEAPTTVEAYLALNDLVSRGSLSAAQQQVALLAVSVENECEFCSVAHRAIGKMKGANAQTLNALASHSEIADAKDRALADFTQAVVRQRGRPSAAEIQAFLGTGFTRQQILEVILIVSIKTLSNYINHLTKPEPNKELLAAI
ncbi:alkyl hydroperoxide reductase AhpD [Ferrigenium kumadai]|uniref:Alkyl hydroperoxide reductase AhpD n=2 Tax=Ferrigenium kumadai TaxID=1682490 RepID=A0AAN1VZI4_9PROT|nr:alkyl hydroperoxide reductase AhpD [Ferrigenium kumadai]